MNNNSLQDKNKKYNIDFLQSIYDRSELLNINNKELNSEIVGGLYTLYTPLVCNKCNSIVNEDCSLMDLAFMIPTKTIDCPKCGKVQSGDVDIKIKYKRKLTKIEMWASNKLMEIDSSITRRDALRLIKASSKNGNFSNFRSFDFNESAIDKLLENGVLEKDYTIYLTCNGCSDARLIGLEMYEAINEYRELRATLYDDQHVDFSRFYLLEGFIYTNIDKIYCVSCYEDENKDEDEILRKVDNAIKYQTFNVLDFITSWNS